VHKSVLSLLGICSLFALPAQAANWSDTSLGYRYGSDFREPANAKKITKNTVSLTHASGYALGGNFFNVDLLKSNSNDPANNNGGTGSGGAQEVYVTYKHNLSMSKVFKQPVKFGPVRDISFTTGFDYSAKNTTFAPGVEKIMVGPTFNFNVPKGFFDIAILYYHEKNHNAFGASGSKDVTFDSTYQLVAAWGIPITLGPVATNFKGFGNYTGSKGKDAVNKETKPETLIRTAWMLDLGAFAGKKGKWLVGPGFEYWQNKFGNASPIAPPVPAPK
jgi:nucleoside-specific outer membrane channel protein Tsx